MKKDFTFILLIILTMFLLVSCKSNQSEIPPIDTNAQYIEGTEVSEEINEEDNFNDGKNLGEINTETPSENTI